MFILRVKANERGKGNTTAHKTIKSLAILHHMHSRRKTCGTVKCEAALASKSKYLHSLSYKN